MPLFALEFQVCHRERLHGSQAQDRDEDFGLCSGCRRRRLIFLTFQKSLRVHGGHAAAVGCVMGASGRLAALEVLKDWKRGKI